MRILIVPNVGNAAAVAAAGDIASWLPELGGEPILVTQHAEAIGMPGLGVPPAETGEPGLTIALGGDGTILKAVHLLGAHEAPVLGVKFGRLGFLSGASPASMRDAIEAAVEGRVRIERRATLRASVVMEGREVGTYRALNEVVLSRGASGRVIAIRVRIDGHALADMRADGVVVATATGSTAYALSAGGPVVSPGFEGMVVVPVAPHTLQARALLTDPGQSVELTLPDRSRCDACVVLDGETTPCRRAIDRVTVTRDPHDVLLAKHDGRDFYETVATEFFGG